MNEQDVDEVAGLVPAGQREHLVHREIHRMEQESSEGIADEGHKAPGGVVGPVDAGLAALAGDDGPHESGEAQLELHGVAERLEPGTIGGEGGRDSRFGVMEEVEVVAIAGGIGCEVQRRTTGEIAGVVRGPGEIGEEPALEFG